MLNETVGEKLKKAREAKRMDIRSVSRETNIIAKYIDAMENNQFEVFPSETYLLGFLKNYAKFLQIDEDDLIRLYQGQQISESQTPLEELTKPTGGNYLQFSFSNLWKSNLLLRGVQAIFILAIGFIIFKIAGYSWNYFNEPELAKIKEESTDIKDKAPLADKKVIILNRKGETILQNEQAAYFEIDGKRVTFFLKKLTPDSLDLILYPKQERISVKLQSATNIDLPNIGFESSFLYKAGTANSAKIEISLNKELTAEGKKNDIKDVQKTLNPLELKIKMNLKTTFNSYVESYVDGKKVYAGLMVSGREVNWTANQSIQLHLGNAEGVQITVNGKIYPIKGKVVNKIFTWKRDPLDPSKYEIVIKDQI